MGFSLFTMSQQSTRVRRVKAMRGISHVAIGVSGMERSLRFYRDLLGLTVSLDKEEPVRGSERLFAEPAQNRRRAVYLKWVIVRSSQSLWVSLISKIGGFPFVVLPWIRHGSCQQRYT